MNCTYRICELEKKRTMTKRIISLYDSLITKCLVLQAFFQYSVYSQSSFDTVMYVFKFCTTIHNCVFCLVWGFFGLLFLGFFFFLRNEWEIILSEDKHGILNEIMSSMSFLNEVSSLESELAEWEWNRCLCSCLLSSLELRRISVSFSPREIYIKEFIKGYLKLWCTWTNIRRQPCLDSFHCSYLQLLLYGLF